MPIKSSTARPWHAPEIKDLLPMCQFCQKWTRFKLKRLHATSNGLLYTDTYVQALMRVQYLVKITHEQSVQISVNPSIPGSYRLCLYLKRSPKRFRQKFWNKHIWYALTKRIVFLFLYNFTIFRIKFLRLLNHWNTQIRIIYLGLTPINYSKLGGGHSKVH